MEGSAVINHHSCLCAINAPVFCQDPHSMWIDAKFSLGCNSFLHGDEAGGSFEEVIEDKGPWS